MTREKIFKSGCMFALALSEMYRGQYGSTLHAICIRHNKRIANAYPTLVKTKPMFIVQVRERNGSKTDHQFPYHKFKQACDMLKQYALMMKGRGTLQIPGTEDTHA